MCHARTHACTLHARRTLRTLRTHHRLRVQSVRESSAGLLGTSAARDSLCHVRTWPGQLPATATPPTCLNLRAQLPGRTHSTEATIEATIIIGHISFQAAIVIVQIPPLNSLTQKHGHPCQQKSADSVQYKLVQYSNAAACTCMSRPYGNDRLSVHRRVPGRPAIIVPRCPPDAMRQ